MPETRTEDIVQISRAMCGEEEDVLVKPKPVFLIGKNGRNAADENQNSVVDGKVAQIHDNTTTAIMPLNNSETKSEFAKPTEGPPRLSLLNKTMFVDVIVNNAVSPVNFSVQNYRQSNNLAELEKSMTVYYDTAAAGKHHQQLSFKDLTLHGYYALKYSSDLGNNVKTKKSRWVRCQVMKPFKENMPIMTHLIDHGFYHTTEPECIQPLKSSFLEMPIQSFEAKLHFVDSSKFQFTPEDCHRFHKEVEGKKFCGIVVQNDSNKQSSNGGNTDDKKSQYKISIILIDTSTEKDVYIHQNFVPKKSR